MARSDSFQKKWASAPSQFERPSDALIDRGWAGGAAEDPPEAKWENWWHNRVDEALAEVESNGALSWFDDVHYGIGSTAHNGGKNWIAAIASTGIEPVGVDNVGHWIEIGAGATEALAGPAKIATQAQADAGTDDATIVTPLKLRSGFSLSLGATGHLALPSWLGGFAVCWGNVVNSVGTSYTFSRAFTEGCYGIQIGPNAAATIYVEALQASGLTNTGFVANGSYYNGTFISGNISGWYLAYGK